MNNYKYSIWCGKHTYFDEEGNVIEQKLYIDPKIRNTGFNSIGLWCGKHSYFDDKGEQIKKKTYIHPIIKNTGFNSICLWCGKYTYFNEDKIDKFQKKNIIYDLVNNKTIINFEEKDIIDLT